MESIAESVLGIFFVKNVIKKALNVVNKWPEINLEKEKLVIFWTAKFYVEFKEKIFMINSIAIVTLSVIIVVKGLLENT